MITCKFIFKDGSERAYSPIISMEGNKTTVTVPRYAMRAEKIQCVEIDTGMMEADAGDEGYMLSAGRITYNTLLTYFKERADIVLEDDSNVMPIMGMRRNGHGTFVIATGMTMDFKAYYEIKNNHYKLMAHFVLDEDDPYEDVSLDIYDMPGATYNEMAHVYRDYQVRTKGLRPIKERIAENPALKYAAESVEIRIRQGWKPCPSPIAHQSPDNEPPMKVVCDFDRVGDLIDEMKAQGIEKAELCLVGWNMGGHDGRFPQLFPADPRLGGDEKMRAVIQKAKDNGYNIVCHDNYTAAYESADCWDEEYVAKFKDGRLGSRHYNAAPLSGGMPYWMCAQRAYERFAIPRMPLYKEAGFRGLHFVDVISCIPPRKCYDPRHPNNAADCRDYFLKIMRWCSENVGGFQSEGAFDFVIQELDYCMYTSMMYRPTPERCKLGDESIPFWEIVYHGYVLSNPDSNTVNFPIKDKDKELFLIERAGRPLMYFYSRFVDEDSNASKHKMSNWMGKTDLVCGTDEEMKESVQAVKAAADHLKEYGWLQYEFMERHDKLADGIYCSTFSDGTRITVDYNKNTYTVEKGQV